MNNQKQNLRRLATILKLFDPEYFYSIAISSGSIRLQGQFNIKIVKDATLYKFTHNIVDNGYLEFCRGKYVITLT